MVSSEGVFSCLFILLCVFFGLFTLSIRVFPQCPSSPHSKGSGLGCVQPRDAALHDERDPPGKDVTYGLSDIGNRLMSKGSYHKCTGDF